jgi:rod shape-determining protein MreC
MAVITADGVVGKVLRVFGQRRVEASTSEVLLINDQSSGVGAILEKSRLQGILRGSAAGEVVLEKVMADEQVQPGDRVLTSGGDQIFPKGLPVGTVVKSIPGSDLFLNIKVKPSANLSKLEEVLVITKTEDKAPAMTDNSNMRAVDILAQRLPSVPSKPAEDPAKAGTANPGTAAPGTAKPDVVKPNAAVGTTPQPAKPAEKPANAVSPATKPPGTALVKPASEQKAPPPAVNVSDPTLNNVPASEVKPKPKPKPQAPTPGAQTDPSQPPPPPEAKPQ